MPGFWKPFHRLTPMDLVVALYNIAICSEADCDPDYTQKELIKAVDRHQGKVTKEALERILFCLNMNDEDGKFWHPLDKTFDGYLKTAIPVGYTFDKDYNLLGKKENFE